MKSKISFNDPLGKVIIIEGLPGIGKSTLLHDQYKLLHLSHRCACYQEETTQPLDLFRQAVLPKNCLADEVEKFISQHPNCRPALEQWLHHNAYTIGGYFIVAYTQVEGVSIPVRQFATQLKCYDVGDGRCSFEEYACYHKMVWRYFAENIYDPQTVYLSEGSLFHNQLFDLIGFYKLSDSQLCTYYKALLSQSEGIDIRLVFIRADNTASLLRQTCQKRPGWYNQLEQWLAYAPWAKENVLRGELGMQSLYNEIQRVHLLLQKELGLQVETITRF